METSVLIARMLAVCYLSFGIGILVNGEFYKRELPKLLDNFIVILYGGIMAIVIGFLILYNNNIEDYILSNILGVIGWMAILKGALIMIFPTQILIYKNNVLNPDNLYTILFPLVLIFGLLFGYVGFFR